MILVARIDGHQMTARDAAKKWAETNWDKPRKIAHWKGTRFSLVDGVNEYAIEDDGFEWVIYRV